MTHPYISLPQTAYWRTAVADRDMMAVTDLWQPKFIIDATTRIATFGSCFAQHFGRELREKGFGWVNAERAPRELSDADASVFGYNLFSARTGNIYTTSILKQWISWAVGATAPPDEVWKSEERYFDPFRPMIEPNGFESIEEMHRCRSVTLSALKNLLRSSNVFVFTLGLTESWFNPAGGYEYPLCPGTIAGKFDKKSHQFAAQSFDSVHENLLEAIALMRSQNRNLKFLLTVSPVPLTATNSGKHVVVATSASKSILRAAAETVANTFDFVDYFPSYEIINSPVFKGAFFEENQRSVAPEGVAFVMKNFFDAINTSTVTKDKLPEPSTAKEEKRQNQLDHEVFCEEELLAAFAPDKDVDDRS